MIGVVGVGFLGTLLTHQFLDLGMLSILCDKQPARAGAEFPGVRVTNSLHDVLRIPEVRAVVIATPTETHGALVRQALLAGKHVLVAAPLTLDATEAQTLFHLASEKKLRLTVALPLLHASGVAALLKLMHSGSLGRISSITSHRLRPPAARREANAAWSFSAEDLSILLLLAGETPHAVRSLGDFEHYSQIAAATFSALEFPSGLAALSLVSWLHPVPAWHCTVVGDQATAVLETDAAKHNRLTVFPAEVHANPPQQIPLSGTNPLRILCKQFVERLDDWKPGNNEGQGVDWMQVQQVLAKAQRSLECQTQARLPSMRHPGVFVHPTAVVDEGVTLGQNVRIWHFCHILHDCNIGEQTNIGQNVMVGPSVNIGARCKIQNNVSVYPGVTLEDGVFCGPSMVFTNVHIPRATIPRMAQALSTPVRTGATLGANCTIICGNEIGEYAFVGAGAVVTKPVPPHALVVGNPAHQIGWVCRCGMRLDQNFVCNDCKEQYEFSDGKLRHVACMSTSKESFATAETGG
jgi:UDP-2-acetamido-3-amino-2,3-dideoxy-glucuronate N-acetyltransferase